MVNLDLIKKVYFIGIGGIGISALARLFQSEGKEVSGSDRSSSEVTTELQEAGVTVFLDQAAANVPADVDLVIYTLAIGADNPEFIQAKELGVPMLTYPEALGLVSSQKYTIAVSGTHGKTTTTAMLGQVLIAAGLEPTVVVGSLVPDWHSNLHVGRGKYFVAEACEYRRSFLNLNPQAVIVTNIDEDHLDYYKDLSDIQSAFAELVSKLPTDGYLVCDPSDENVKPILAQAQCRVIDYTQVIPLTDLNLSVAGVHNKKDAQAALALALALGVERERALETLKNFKGTWRRFELKGKLAGGVLVYDDYAHHPTEIEATLAAARENLSPTNKIMVVFQPHLYSRTKQLLTGFSRALAKADYVLVIDIYPAREIDDGTISSAMLVDSIKHDGGTAFYTPTLSQAVSKARELLPEFTTGDILLTMGAGEAFRVGDEVLHS